MPSAKRLLAGGTLAAALVAPRFLHLVPTLDVSVTVSEAKVVTPRSGAVAITGTPEPGSRFVDTPMSLGIQIRCSGQTGDMCAQRLWRLVFPSFPVKQDQVVVIAIPA